LLFAEQTNFDRLAVKLIPLKTALAKKFQNIKSEVRIMSKVVGAQEAVALVKTGMTIVVGGFVGCGVPELLLQTLRGRYLQSNEPKNLFLVYIAGHGSNGAGGVNHLALEGLISKTLGKR
jgi:acyl CoA:acetate/3-ketoacid CoA transferase